MKQVPHPPNPSLSSEGPTISNQNSSLVTPRIALRQAKPSARSRKTTVGEGLCYFNLINRSEYDQGLMTPAAVFLPSADNIFPSRIYSKMAQFLLFAPLFISILASANASAVCYYPDGKTTDPTHVPCNQTMSTASACCASSDSCSTSGFCLGGSGWVYRGSCTDQNWDSENCPKRFSQCITGNKPNPETDAGTIWKQGLIFW